MGNSLDKSIYVKLTATPDAASLQAAENHILTRILGFTDSDTAEGTAGWTGSFSDSQAKEADKIGKLSAFNYDLYGSGTGTVTLRWNTAYVDINPFFLTKYGLVATSEETGIKQVAIRVNSSLQSDYQIQFYRTSTPEGETWNAGAGSVQCGTDVYVTCTYQGEEQEQ
jgi:hypothetical protein